MQEKEGAEKDLLATIVALMIGLTIWIVVTCWANSVLPDLGKGITILIGVGCGIIVGLYINKGIQPEPPKVKMLLIAIVVAAWVPIKMCLL